MTVTGRARRKLDLVFVMFLLTPPPGAVWAAQFDSEIDLVAVAVVGGGRAVVLATPGIPRGDRLWRLRSFDTSDLPQPIRDVSLSASGTKLMIQPASGPPVIVDLTSYRLSVTTLQYMRPHTREGNGGVPATHRLPGQHFVSVRDGRAYVVDDVGRVQPQYPVIKAALGAISDDGALLIVNGDGAPRLSAHVRRVESHQSGAKQFSSTSPTRSEAVQRRSDAWGAR
jgi:hypothetical protein